MRGIHAALLVIFQIATPGVTSFDFLNIPTTASSAAYGFSAVSERGSLEGLWGNPASIAGLDGRASVLLAHHYHLDIHLFSGATSLGMGPFQVSGGISVLLPGEVQGAKELQSIGNPLNSGDVHLLMATSLQCGKSFKLPFDLDVGAAIGLASETLSEQKMTALFFSTGLIIGFPIGKFMSLNFGLDARNLGFRTDGSDVPVPQKYSAGLKLGVRLAQSFSLGALVQCEISKSQENDYFMGLDTWLLDLFFIKGGIGLSGSSVSLTVGGGVKIKLGPQQSLSLEVAYLPSKKPEAQVIYQALVTLSANAPKKGPPARDLSPFQGGVKGRCIGVLVGSEFFNLMRGPLETSLRKNFSDFIFTNDGYVLAGSGVNWTELDALSYLELTKKMKVDYLLAVLKNDSVHYPKGVIFLFNATTGRLVQKENFELISDDLENISTILKIIDSWKI